MTTGKNHVQSSPVYRVCMFQFIIVNFLILSASPCSFSSVPLFNSTRYVSSIFLSTLPCLLSPVLSPQFPFSFNALPLRQLNRSDTIPTSVVWIIFFLVNLPGLSSPSLSYFHDASFCPSRYAQTTHTVTYSKYPDSHVVIPVTMVVSQEVSHQPTL